MSPYRTAKRIEMCFDAVGIGRQSLANYHEASTIIYKLKKL